MSDTDPTGPRRLLRHRGKTCNLQEEKPYSWGRKNPISHLSRMKNPDLPYPSVAAALRAYVLRPASLDVRTPWEPLLPSSSLSKAKVRALARPCQLIAVCLVISRILTTPCVLSLVLTIAIYAMPPPPRAI